MSARISRRQFLRVSGVTAAGAILAACGATPTATPVPPTATKPPAPTNTPAPAAKPAAATATPVPPTATKPAAPTNTPAPAAAKYKEAPLLADRVKSGKIPAVDQRLPANPLVVTGPDGIGKYGGTLKYLDGQTRLSVPHRITDHGLFGYNQATSAYHPDVAESYSWNADSTALTIKLRKGMRWSDGTPLTSKDFQWYWENVLWNKDINPNGPGATWVLKAGNAKLTVTDDYTFTYTWPSPNPAVMDAWGRSSFSAPGSYWGPSHWLKQFHPAGADRAALNAAAEKAGFATDSASEAWVKLFGTKTGQVYDGIRWDPTMPTVRPWNPIEITQAYLLLERNPYFHYVDKDGNQLPYFDQLRCDAVADLELYNLKITAGESDAGIWFPSFDKMELYKANETKGNYTTLIAKSLDVAPDPTCVFFNMTTPDETKRALFQSVEFRQAFFDGFGFFLCAAQIAPDGINGLIQRIDPEHADDSIFSFPGFHVGEAV